MDNIFSWRTDARRKQSQCASTLASGSLWVDYAHIWFAAIFSGESPWCIYHLSTDSVHLNATEHSQLIAKLHICLKTLCATLSATKSQIHYYWLYIPFQFGIYSATVKYNRYIAFTWPRANSAHQTDGVLRYLMVSSCTYFPLVFQIELNVFVLQSG